MPFRLFLSFIAAFIAAKLVFLGCYASAEPVGVADIFAVVRHGLSLDLATAAYLTALPTLAAIALLWLPIKAARWIVRLMAAYLGIVAIVLVLAFTADTSLYAFWGFKLSAAVLPYLDNAEGITRSVSFGYLLIRILIIMIVAAAIAYCLWRQLSYRDRLLVRSWYPWRRRIFEPSGPADIPPHHFRRPTLTIAYIVALPLLLLAARGGFGVSTTNVGQVYFSERQYLNHAAVNPVFSFMASLEHGAGDYDIYHYYSEAEAAQIVRGLYTTSSKGTPRLVAARRPDILLIIMEGGGWQMMTPEIMPRLHAEARRALSFTRCYAASWRTDRGVLSTLSGYPAFPEVSVMKMPDKSRTMPSIAATLRSRGYATTFLYGGDANFTNMRSYLMATGWQRIISEDDYTASQRGDSKWGVRDDITADTIPALLDGGRQPTLTAWLTLSSHEPWDVPEQRLTGKEDNSFAYLDNCIGRLFDRLRKSGRWSRTLVVITADHNIGHRNTGREDPEHDHIPFIITGGALASHRQVPTLCSQTDIAATLLAQLGLPHAGFAFSRDVLSPAYRRHSAVNMFSNGFALQADGRSLVYDLGTTRSISKPDERLERLGKAILQTTAKDLKVRSYKLGVRSE